MRIKTRRWLMIALCGLGLSLSATLVLSALNEQVSFFYSPSDLHFIQPEGAFRLGGLVARGSVIYGPAPLDLHFSITDDDKAIPVHYHGLVPDLFREGQGVVAEGRLNEDGLFIASRILARHDEYYMPPEVKDALERAQNQQQEGDAGG